MNNRFYILIAAIMVAKLCLAADTRLVLASLNPIASDLAHEVGGDCVEVIDLIDSSQDPHSFTPDPADLRKASKAKIFLAMGKGLETYLGNIEGALGVGQIIFEIGEMVPSLRMERAQTMLTHGRDHDHSHKGSIDPHWWQSPPNMRKAAILLAKRLALSDQNGAAQYEKNAREYAKRLDELDNWARERLAGIPRQKRVLTSSHAAFNYLCEEYGLKPMPIRGLSSMDQPKPSEIAEIVHTIKREKIPAIFPESTSSDKMLNSIAAETGVKIGETLYAGTLPPENPSYIHLIRHNINAIAKALNSKGNDE